MDYAEVLHRLVRWAEDAGTVRAVLLTGSAATGEEHPLSDRDIEVYALDPETVLHDESWWDGLGDVLVVERLTNENGHPTRLVYYAGGKLDFTVAPAAALPAAAHGRPFRVLLDKDGCAPISPQGAPPGALPARDEFDEALQWAYAAALMCARAVARDELWSATLRDRDLKDQLLRMIEWDHRIRYGPGHDTRHLGSDMSTWMDADVRQELSRCWGRFDAADLDGALSRTVTLFARLAERTATALGFGDFRHESRKAEIDRILAYRANRPG